VFQATVTGSDRSASGTLASASVYVPWISLPVPQQANAAVGTTLYVDGASTTCSDSGTGTQAVPYCTIQAAANAATAGDDVLITGADYDDETQVTISKSGTATAPITFESRARRIPLESSRSAAATSR
jgi:hypothetical protein